MTKRNRRKVVIASMAPFVGGAEVAAERLALGLQDADHEVLILLGKRDEVMDRMQRAGLTCVYTPMFFTDRRHYFRYWKARNALRSVIKTEMPDIIHSNDLPTHQIVSDAARGLGIPRICHHRFPFDGTCIDWLNKYGAEKHLFVSEALAKEMTACSQKLDASPRSVVYDGLPLPELPERSDRLRAREKLGIPSDKTIVLFVGQMIERKGVADLVRAWASLDPAIRAVSELVLVGDDLAGKGEYRMEMERLADETECQARFVGFQRNVGEWLCASDISVVPSHVEPLGNATLEAMSYGLPVIGCHVGGIPEMIVHEQTGLLVSPHCPSELADALSSLILDGELRAQLGSNGRSRCEEMFSLQAHVSSVLQEYNAAIGVA